MSVFCKIGKRNKKQKQKQKQKRRSLTLSHFQNTSRFLVLGKRNKKQKQERRRLTTLLHFQNTSPLPRPGVASFFFHFVPAVFSCSNTRPRSHTTFSPLTTFCYGYSPTSTFVSVKASLRKLRQCLEAPLKSSFTTFLPLWSHTADVSHLMSPLHTLLHPKHQHHPAPSPPSRTLLHTIASPWPKFSCVFFSTPSRQG
jgi:hypothetical protein